MINKSWMDTETKTKAIQKLNNIKINIGTTYRKDFSSYYEFNNSISLVKNIINLKKVATAKSYAMLDTNETYNALPDYTFNAYYDVTSNSINILTNDKASKEDYQKTYESFAKIWSNNYSKSTKVMRSFIDTHSTNEIRVNSVLSSTNKFYEIYKIDSNDSMHIKPEERVNIWS